MRFEIEGVNKEGKKGTIIVTAKSEQEAITKAKRSGVSPTRVHLHSVSVDFPASRGGQHSEYEYRTMPLAMTIVSGQHAATVAARYFQDAINTGAAEGWDFHRVDTVNVYDPPGCVASLLGIPGETKSLYVMTFRRKRHL